MLRFLDRPFAMELPLKIVPDHVISFQCAALAMQPSAQRHNQVQLGTMCTRLLDLVATQCLLLMQPPEANASLIFWKFQGLKCMNQA